MCLFCFFAGPIVNIDPKKNLITFVKQNILTVLLVLYAKVNERGQNYKYS